MVLVLVWHGIGMAWYWHGMVLVWHGIGMVWYASHMVSLTVAGNGFRSPGLAPRTLTLSSLLRKHYCQTAAYIYAGRIGSLLCRKPYSI
jgi:hypothetical protein